MPVSVVVATYAKERFSDLLRCLDSLRRQTLPPLEIIVVIDRGGSTLDFYRSQLPSDVKVVVARGRGLSNARNAGVRAAIGEIVAFIDDDATADRNWLTELTEAYADSKVIGTGGRIVPVWEDRRPGWFPEELDWIVGCSFSGLPLKQTAIRNPIGCNMSFRKDIFDLVGYFKTTVGRFSDSPMAGEEAEFSVRAVAKIPGSKIVLVPSAVVNHRVPRKRARLRYLVKRSFYEGYSKAIIGKTICGSTRTLATEQSYLARLLTRAIPSRLIRFYQMDRLSQSIAISISVSAVLVGFVYGGMMKNL